MPRQLLRVSETRRLDNPNDARTTAEVLAADSSAANLEIYTQAIITQIQKIIGRDDWKNEPPASLKGILDSLEVTAANFIWNEELSGNRNGTNLVFTTAHNFVPITLRLYLNGQRMLDGVGNDFEMSESSGVGTGYDTVTFLSPELAPLPGESVKADYLKT